MAFDDVVMMVCSCVGDICMIYYVIEQKKNARDGVIVGMHR